MTTTRMVQQAQIQAPKDQRTDAVTLAQILEMLPEGDKRELMGYAKCLYASMDISRSSADHAVRSDSHSCVL